MRAAAGRKSSWKFLTIKIPQALERLRRLAEVLPSVFSSVKIPVVKIPEEEVKINPGERTGNSAGDEEPVSRVRTLFHKIDTSGTPITE
jgi:hypothetical protein